MEQLLTMDKSISPRKINEPDNVLMVKYSVQHINFPSVDLFSNIHLSKNQTK